MSKIRIKTRLRGRTPHKIVIAAGVAASVVGLGVLAFGTAASAATSYTTFGGVAYGSYVRVGTTVRSDHTSDIPLCTTMPGKTNSDSAASTNVPDVGTVGAVSTSVRSVTHSPSDQHAIATSTTNGINLFGGAVTASAVTAQADVKYTGSGYTYTPTVKLVGLEVGGLPVSNSPSANQTVTLPDGLGVMTLNSQRITSSNGLHQLSVYALRLTVAAGNTLGIAAGSQVTIGYASALIRLTTHALPYGKAYGTLVQVGDTVQSGPTAPVYLPCGGTAGTTVDNSTASVTPSDALDASNVHTYASSSDTSSLVYAHTRSTVESASLLTDVVQVTGVDARSQVSRSSSGAMTYTTTGTTIGTVKINGVTRPVTTQPNQAITIDGVGTLYLFRVVRVGTEQRVYAVELILSQEVDGVPAGTVIAVGAARAGVDAP